MFGYIRPDEPYLYKKDDVLYQALYCGVCKGIGSSCGQMARFSLTYDIAFLSAIAHNVCGVDVEIKKSHCVIHPITKRPIAKIDELSKKLGAVNVILAKYKVTDDKIDGKKGFLKGLFLNRGYKKARRLMSEVDALVKKRYEELRELERSDNGLIDRVCEPFSLMLAEISDAILGDFATQNTHDLFFYIGKWIYVIDALDDYDKDLKRGEYNPFVTCYKKADLKSLVEECVGDLDFMFADIFNGISSNFSKISFKFNKDLISNILLRGIPARTAKVLEGKNK